MSRAILLGAIASALAAALTGCLVRQLAGPTLTGTCEGACAHYVECKPGHPEVDRGRCLAECPGVFDDPDSLMAYESLSCRDAVEYVDGSGAAPRSAKTAAQR